MHFTCENDHVINLANFDSLIAKIVSFGKHYRPSREEIRIEALSIISHNAKIAIENVTQLTNQHIHSVNVREVVFDSLKIRSKNIFHVLTQTTLLNETEIYMLVGCSNVVCSAFASQSRYDFLLDNFCKIIKMLKTNILYEPNDKELEIEGLEAFYAILYLKNNQVKQNHALLANACLIRNEVLYRERHGLVALAAITKMYIKYHYGWESPQFKQVAELLIKKSIK